MSKQHRARILIVDDESSARIALTELLREENFDVQSAADGFKALGRLDKWQPDILLTDLKMPGLDGRELMAKVRERVPDVSVIVMTAFGTVESAVAAIHEGANDYLTKPLHVGSLLVVLQRVLEHRKLVRETSELRARIAERAHDEAVEHGLVGRSRAFRGMMSLVEQVADSDASISMVGDPGTGKECVARALHQLSNRREAPFRVLRCSAMSEVWLEQQLFGPDGAFPGAIEPGTEPLTDTSPSTVFLDDVSELSPSLQAKLSSALQRGFAPASDGGPSGARIIVASSSELQDEVDAGRFREDLFYRLNVIRIRIPSLRERVDDIPLLATHFLERFARTHHKTLRGFTERALGVLMKYDWPGNVAQLENCIERAAVLARGQEIEPRELPRELMSASRASDEMPRVPGATLRELERYAILQTLEHVGGSTSKAARILGISARKIQYRLAEYREDDPGIVASTTRGRRVGNEESTAVAS